MKRLRRNGFTLIEALLALFITGLVSLLGCMLVSCALHFAHMDMDTQNQFAILQLRRELSVASEVKVENEQLEYILNHEKFRLYFDKHRIVRGVKYGIKRNTPHKKQCKEDGNKSIPNLAYTLGLPFRPHYRWQCSK